jgi:hypothetical protein
MMDMHQHMQSMEDQTAKMRATLEKMKSNLSKITDPALKQQAQYDIDLWEEMVQHMEGMSKMMKAHEGMGMMDGMKAPSPNTGRQAAGPREKVSIELLTSGRATRPPKFSSQDMSPPKNQTLEVFARASFTGDLSFFTTAPGRLRANWQQHLLRILLSKRRRRQSLQP